MSEIDNWGEFGLRIQCLSYLRYEYTLQSIIA